MLDDNSNSELPWMKLMATKMKSKFDKYWGASNLLISIAAVLDPRNKMKLINFTFNVMYSEIEAPKEIRLVHDSLYELYKVYVDAYATSTIGGKSINVVQDGDATNKGSNSTACIGKGKVLMTGRSKYEDYVMSSETESVMCELDTYLGEGVYICKGNSGSFNALEWWKASSLKFRILSKMACEILSIPITTVASESTFSAGGRVIDTYRSSLGTDTVQMLLCGSDWYRNFYGIKKKGKSKEEVQEFQLS